MKELQENLRKSGLDSNKAKMVLQAWSKKVGHEVRCSSLLQLGAAVQAGPPAPAPGPPASSNLPACRVSPRR